MKSWLESVVMFNEAACWLGTVGEHLSDRLTSRPRCCRKVTFLFHRLYIPIFVASLHLCGLIIINDEL